jgi:serine/threonine protein kinase/Flp pilus assembly protein TadD
MSIGAGDILDGRFAVERSVATGGMGEVFRGLDRQTGALVAVKTVRIAGGADRFQREIQILSTLRHPGIVAYLGHGRVAGEFYLVMEWLEGEDLGARLAGAELSIQAAVSIAVQVAAALGAAHSQGVVHRDVKPSNVFLADWRVDRVKLLDYGVARWAGMETLTGTGLVVGTPAYMAPEQARGERDIDARADVYSLGALLFRCLAGRPPFEGENPNELMAAALHRPAPPLGELIDVNPELAALVGQMLDKDPRRRPADGDAAWTALVNIDVKGLAATLPSPRRAKRSSVALPTPATISVAALYLENLSGAVEDEYFRDGITEDIITELVKIRSIQVFPRAAVRSFRDRPITAPEVGEALHATHVLAGSLRRAGPHLRITVQLAESRSGHSVWAERYDRELKDVFAVQEDIARCIAQALRISLTPEEDSRIARKHTANLDAYDYFLRGRSETRRGNLVLALQMFEQALRCDADFAPALAGIANASARMYYLRERNPQWLQRADAAVNRAFELDSQLPEAFVARARIAYAREQYKQAADYARMAIERRLDCEGSWDILGRALFASDRSEEAAELIERAIKATGDDYNVYVPYGNALRALGRTAAAETLERQFLGALELQVQLVPEDTRARMLLANSYARLSRRADAIRELEQVLAARIEDPHTIYNAACCYGILRLKSEALATLERAVNVGFSEWDLAVRDPDLACVRDEPAFVRITNSMKTQASSKAP